MLDNTLLEYFDRSLREKKPSPISDRNRLLMAGAMATAPSVTNGVAHLMSRNTLSLKSLILPSIVMGAIGYITPTIINKAATIEDDKERKEYLRQQFAKASILPSIQKSASYSAAGNLLATVGKYGLKGAKDLIRGVGMPLKGNKTMGQAALSVGSKALLGYGSYKTGKKVIEKAKTPNYITYLRNQVVAGNIKPQDMTEGDFASVRKLGL